MRCPTHCPPASALRAPLGAAVGVFCVAALAVWWLTGAWLLVAAVATVLATVAGAVTVAVVRVSRWSARLSLRSPNTVAAMIRRGALPAPRWPDRPALGAAPPPAIEAAPVRVSDVLPGVSATVLPPRARPEGAAGERRARA